MLSLVHGHLAAEPGGRRTLRRSGGQDARDSGRTRWRLAGRHRAADALQMGRQARTAAGTWILPPVEKLQQTLAQAGFLKSSAPQTYQVARVLLAIGGGVLGLLIGLIFRPASATPMLLGVGGIGIGIFVPSYYLGRRARTRQSNIAKQLSDVLDLLVVCVEAGMGLFEAIRIVGTECERHGQEIGTELNLVATDISAGASLGQALRGLADRTAVDDIKPLAATLIQSEQLGAQIGPALRASSDALRMHRRLHAEEDAQKASIKILFPLVIFVLPSMIAVIIGPAMISVLRTLSNQGG